MGSDASEFAALPFKSGYCMQGAHCSCCFVRTMDAVAPLSPQKRLHVERRLGKDGKVSLALHPLCARVDAVILKKIWAIWGSGPYSNSS